MKRIKITSFGVHIIAYSMMLVDHAGLALFPEQIWLRTFAKLGFPLFVFMIAEGIYYTHDLRKYLTRIVLFAFLAEIPRDLIIHRTFVSWESQNVLWGFAIGIVGVILIKKICEKGFGFSEAIISFTVILGCGLIEFIAGVEFRGMASICVIAYYFMRESKWYFYLGRLAVLIPLPLLFGWQQWFAGLALIPIMFYSGERGYHAKWFKWFCYLFYPLHWLMLYSFGLFLN